MGWYDLRVGLWIVVVRPAGIEPTLLVPETSVLSVELRALRLYSGTPGGIALLLRKSAPFCVIRRKKNEILLSHSFP